jgi:asparagine synthase (glutamine-hydrolysing)
MSGLCGWSCGARASATAPEVNAAMRAAISRFDNSPIRSAAAGLGFVAAGGSAADVYRDDQQIVAVWGPARVDDPELKALAAQHGIAHALAHAYSRRNTGAFDLLAGSFALAIVNTKTGETVLATDHIGTYPLLYFETADALVFASTFAAISAFDGLSSNIDSQAIYDYVYFHMVPAPRTMYSGCRRLLPGTFLKWRNGKSETHAYWRMRFVEREKRAFPELKEAFRASLRDGVRRAAADGKAGAFLSGGTDSSTIAGMLGEVTGEPARTYSIGFEAEGYDEMEYARIAARHFGTRHHEYYVTPEDVMAAIPRIAAIHDQPFGNASAVPTYYCARMAKADGIDTLLGGDGGDELFGGNDRYAKQYLYSLYSDLPAALRTRVIEPIVFLAPEIGIVGQAQRYMRNAVEPMPARYDNYNLLARLGAGNVFTESFLAGVDQLEPQRQMAHAYQEADARTLINRMLALDLRFTLADNDLPKVIRSCELAGVEVRFPMLDDAVVSFSASLSPRLKLKGTRLRYFFKEALRDFLPPEIITKQKHGFGLPVGTWLRTYPRLQQLAGDSLHDLKERRIVRPEFIDELLSTRVADHPAYYGTMVWILMMLEQWFQQHRQVRLAAAL